LKTVESAKFIQVIPTADMDFVALDVEGDIWELTSRGWTRAKQRKFDFVYDSGNHQNNLEGYKEREVKSLPTTGQTRQPLRKVKNSTVP